MKDLTKQQIDEVLSFARLLSKNIMLQASDTLFLSERGRIIMFFAGELCSNSDKRYRYNTTCSIASMMQCNRQHVYKIIKSISHLVDNDCGEWKLSKHVEDFLIKISDEKPKKKKKDNQKPTKFIDLPYHHDSLVDWYFDFCEQNGFDYNQKDVEKVQAIEIDDCHKFVSSYLSDCKKTKASCFSSKIKTFYIKSIRKQNGQLDEKPQPMQRETHNVKNIQDIIVWFKNEYRLRNNKEISKDSLSDIYPVKNDIIRLKNGPAILKTNEILATEYTKLIETKNKGFEPTTFVRFWNAKKERIIGHVTSKKEIKK